MPPPRAGRGYILCEGLRFPLKNRFKSAKQFLFFFLYVNEFRQKSSRIDKAVLKVSESQTLKSYFVVT